jgi:probable F420-dependent oxidoreductase
MRYGMALSFTGHLGTPWVVERLAGVVDRAGLDGFWVGDHVVFPPELPADYPYADDGEVDVAGELSSLESVTSLAYVARMAPRARLGVSVLVLPQRNPVLLTKTVTTLDLFTGGRAVFGVGAGWLRGEFEALGADFAARGAVMDEFLEVYRRLCRDERPSFSGRYYTLPEVAFYPKPVQRPWPPIVVGGNSARALRRAVRFGDEWQPVAEEPAQTLGMRARLDAECAAQGRDPAEVRLAVRCFFHLTGTPHDEAVAAGLSAGQLYGTGEELADLVGRYEDSGVEEILFTPVLRRDLDLHVEQHERFVREVVGADC